MEKYTFLLLGLLCLSITALGFTPPYLVQPANEVKSLSQNQTFSWVTNNDVNSHRLNIYECDYEQSSLTKSINLGDYRLLDTEEISDARKVSGLTWAEGFSKPLIVCADEFQQIDAYSPTFVRSIINRLFGFSTAVENYKGITHLYNDHYGLIDEATGKLMYFDFIPQTFANITYPLIPSFDLNVNINNANEGLEGIAYNQFNNSIYVAKEKSPMQLFEFKAASSPNFNSSPGNLTQPFNLENAAKRWGIKNVSGLFHLSKSTQLNGTEASNNLLVLSSESYTLIECDLEGNEISRLSLNIGGANGTISQAIASAQGIAYGDGRIYILSSAIPERNIPAKFYSFSNTQYKEATTTIGKQIYTKSNIQGNSYSISNLNIDNGKTYCWNIEGTNFEGQKYASNYFSFGDETVEPPKPEVEEKISIRKPFFNTTYRPGDIVDIEWTQNIDFSVNVYFYNFSSGSNPVRTPVTNFNGRKVQFEIPTNSFTGNNYSIRVVSASDETNYASVKFNVDADFIPIGGGSDVGPTGDPAIAISSPSAGQSYLPGSNLPVRWTYNSNDKVVISLKSGDNSEVYELKSQYNNSGLLNVNIPFIPKSNEYYIEINSTRDDRITNRSAKFTIAPKAGISNIKLSNGFMGDDSKYLPGDKIVLTWNDQIQDDVIIQLYDKTKWVSGFTGVTKSDGYEQITLKSTLPIDYRIDYRVRIISKKDNQVFAYSKPFKIAKHKAYNFVVPQSTVYNSKNMMVVRWEQLLSNVNGLDRVKLILKQKNKTVKQITGSTRNDGLYYWIPDVKDGENYQLFLQSTTNEGLVSSSPLFSLVNGQAKLMQQPDFVVAPNPASDFVNVTFKNTFDGKINLELYNVNGAFLKEYIVDEKIMKLDVSELSPGYYFLNMKDEEHIINKKILIK